MTRTYMPPGASFMAMRPYALTKRTAIRLLTVIAIMLSCAGCAHRPAMPPTRVLEKPCDTCMRGVANFARVSDALWRGAQPSREGFRALEAAGVKTIVNLRSTHDDLPMLEGTGLKYLWLPEQPGFPDEQDVVIFLKVLEDPANRPVFVHCKQGRDRTGCMVGAYRIIDQDWSADDAIHEMFDFRFNTIFFENAIFLRSLNKDRVRSRVRICP